MKDALITIVCIGLVLCVQVSGQAQKPELVVQTGPAGVVGSIAFSPDGKLLASPSFPDGAIKLWEVTTGRELRTLAGHSSRIESVAFSPDGKWLVSGSRDQTNKVWEVATGKLLATLIALDREDWAVVSPDGYFDTGNLDEIRGLHWVMPDDPLKTLPLEIFMRDYYEPRLLPRLLEGDQLKPVRSLAELNRVQPIVKITNIEQQKDNPDLATVTVEVSSARAVFGPGAKKITRETGVYDVRLFRDGQIVGQKPQSDIIITAVASEGKASDAEEMLGWRRSAQVKLDQSGKQFIRFDNIRLPRSADIEQVEFSVYAFNEDRVKSETDKKVFDIPERLTPRKGRAFIVTVGVNAYQNTDWNLRFAADDAKITQRVLSQKLRQAGEYVEVVSITLLSDYGSDGRLTEKAATKANFKAVLDALAGRKANAQLLRSIANADKLSKATPEDLVVISIASHGDADKQGDFYLFPYDIGEGRGQAVTQALLSRCISSDELSVWLRDVDAGEMVLIVDACHSAASVEGQGFKPGPMGSRGLGQLAYDKGMRILAASQADDVAIESEQVRAGLLTYALIRDGIEGLLADRRPRDQKILLDEWLRYGAERVPGLYEEVRRGEVKQAGRGQRAKIVLVKQGKSLKRAAQQPQLFDFAKKRREVVLVK